MFSRNKHSKERKKFIMKFVVFGFLIVIVAVAVTALPSMQDLLSGLPSAFSNLPKTSSSLPQTLRDFFPEKVTNIVDQEVVNNFALQLEYLEAEFHNDVASNITNTTANITASSSVNSTIKVSPEEAIQQFASKLEYLEAEFYQTHNFSGPTNNPSLTAALTRAAGGNPSNGPTALVTGKLDLGIGSG